MAHILILVWFLIPGHVLGGDHSCLSDDPIRGLHSSTCPDRGEMPGEQYQHDPLGSPLARMSPGCGRTGS